jgi:hypothetical protein
MKRISTLVTFAIPGLYMLVFADRAFAYMDPGSGSMMLQLLLGGIAGVGVIIKLYWKSFLNLFRSRRNQSESLSPKNEIHE